ncbi:MAG: flagellar export chaperone FliS [Alphaproteobacteria bacterium]|nr:flagellar export chaperone FliS [Alphaproteobacteria bacterium]OJV13886.1 MAG: flagellar export chaperone FliS [Alphaproteobacteria bacterium 33-17]
MSIVNKGYSRYLNQIPSGNIQQVIMLYKGAIKHMNKVIDCIQNNDVENRFNVLEKATGIVLGLKEALDHKNAKDIAQALESYYNHVYIKMMSVHHTPDVKQCEEILKDLNNMLESWREVEKTIDKDIKKD